MADLDSLNIQISATTTKATNAINSLIGQLGELDEALNRYSADSTYIKGLTNIASGLSSVAKASQGINVEGLTAVTDTIDKLVTKGELLKKLDFSSLSNIHISEDQFSGISVIANSLGKLTGKNVDKARTTLPILASGLASLSNIHIASDSGESIASLASGLAKLGGAKVVAGQEVGRIAEGLRQLQFVRINNAEDISALASALGKLGKINIEESAKNLPKMATAFNELLSTLSHAPQISSETIQIAQAMAQLATATRGVSQGTNKASTGINMLQGAIRASFPTFKMAQKHTFNLASMFGKLYASYFLVIRAVRGLGSAIDTSSKLTEVQNVVATTFGDMSYKLDDFAETAMYDFGMAELSAKQFASRFQSMGGAMGITEKQVADANNYLTTALEGQKRVLKDTDDSYENLGNTMADLSINLTKLVGDYASFYNMDYDDVAKDFESIFTGQTRPMRIYGIDLTNATLKEWAMKAGLDADIDSMTQAEKTMLRYQYVMAHSGKVMNDFAITADTWANVVRTIGQQFVKLGSIIGSGLINVFKPVLINFRNFMNTFLDLTEKGLNAVGKLLGWQVSIEEVGISMDDSMEDYVDDLDDAVGSAKKLNSQLRGIDELNNLSTNKGSGKGSGDSLLGGSGGATGGGIKFEEVPALFESDIDSWFQLGTSIRDKLLEGMGSISWEDISERVKLNASNFVDLLKGILMPDEEGKTLGGEMGRFLAEAINLGFDWLVTATGDKQLWQEAGLNIGQFFVNALTNFDAKDAGETVNNIAQGLFTMISVALGVMNDPENRKKALAKIGEFLSTLDWQTYTLIIGAIGFSILAGTVKSVGTWALTQGLPDLASKLIGDKLSSALKTNVPETVVDNVKVSTPKGGIKVDGADAIGYAVGAVIGAEIGRNIVSVIVYGEEGYFEWNELALAIHDFFADPELKGGFVDNWKALGENVGVLFTEGFDSAFMYWVKRQRDLDSLWWEWFGSDELSKEIDVFYNPHIEVIEEKVDIIGENTDIGSKLLKSLENRENLLAGITQGAEIGKNIVKGIEQGEEDEANSSTIKDKARYVKDKIIESLMIAFKVHSPAETSKPIGKNIILGIFEGFDLVNFAQKMQEWFNKNVMPWFSKDKWTFSGISDGLSDAWTNAIEAVKQIWNSFANWMNEKLHFTWESKSILGKEVIPAGEITLGKLPTFANGGYPQTGSLFYAGEAGTELLGTMNGRTTVASNGEITGITDAIRQTSSEEIQLLRQQNLLLQGILQKEFGISKGELFRSVRSSASEYQKMTGNPAFT